MDYILENMMHTRRILAEETIKKAGMWDEYLEFRKRYGCAPVDAWQEFCKIHPDVFVEHASGAY